MSPNRDFSVFSFSTAVTLKFWSRSQKSNQFFVMPQWDYIAMKICKNSTAGSKEIVQTRQCCVDANVNAAAQNQYPPPPRVPVGGHNMVLVFISLMIAFLFLVSIGCTPECISNKLCYREAHVRRLIRIIAVRICIKRLLCIYLFISILTWNMICHYNKMYIFS